MSEKKEKKIFMTKLELRKCLKLNDAREAGNHIGYIEYVGTVMKRYGCDPLDYYDTETGEILKGSWQKTAPSYYGDVCPVCKEKIAKATKDGLPKRARDSTRTRKVSTGRREPV